METDKIEAFETLQTYSCGLEEIFLSAGTDLVLTEDSEAYAIKACKEILNAIEVIKQ